MSQKSIERNASILRRLGINIESLLLVAAALFFSVGSVGASGADELRLESSITSINANISTTFFTWGCGCNGTFESLFTAIPVSNEFGAPTAVEITSIEVNGDLGSSSEFIDFKVSQDSDYLRYPGGADSSTYTLYSYTGSQPSVELQGNEYGFLVDIFVPDAVNFDVGLDGIWWNLRINMSVTYDDGSVQEVSIGAVSSIDSINTGDLFRYFVDIDSQAAARFSELRIGTRGGAGDVDLFVGEGFIPTPYQNFSCGSDRVGNSEVCVIANPSGRYWFSVFGFQPSTNVEVFVLGLGTPEPPVVSAGQARDLAALISFDAPRANGARITNYNASCQLVDELSGEVATAFTERRDAALASPPSNGVWSIEKFESVSTPRLMDEPTGATMLTAPHGLVTAAQDQRIALPDMGADVELMITAARTTDRSNRYLTGTVSSGGTFSLLVTPGGELVGKVHLQNDVLVISPSLQRGGSLMESTVNSGLQPLQVADDMRLLNTPLSPQATQQAEVLSDTPSSVIDVLMLYDSALPNPVATADYLLQYANDIHERSGTGVTLSATSFRMFNRSSFDPLAEISTSATVADWRDRDRADLVAWFGDFSVSYGYCGVAYVPGANGSSFVNNVRGAGFSVTLVGSDGSAFCSDETFAHEIGHNMGAVHDRANSGAVLPFYDYAYGDGLNGVFGTVQSYISPQVGRFSSPNLACSGRPCGQEGFTDVVRALDNVREIVANIYDGSSDSGAGNVYTVTPSITFGGAVFPSSPRSATQNSQVSFTFSPDTGYRLEGVSGNCAGVVEGNTYTVTVGDSDCGFSGVFTPSGRSFSVAVTALPASGGSVSPQGVINVVPFDSLPVEITPSGGFSLASIGGTCEGQYSAGLFRTSEITSACSLEVIFASTSGLTSGSGSPLLVSGLTEGRAYSCSVTATNRFGDSAPSNSVQVVPIKTEPPNAPSISRVDAWNGEATVYFQPGFNGFLSVTYTATCGDRSFSGDSSPLTVTGLSNGETVSCSVTAENSRGSAESARVSVTPEEISNKLPVWLLYEMSKE